VNPYNASQEIHSACNYLESTYNASVRLIPETNSDTRYYLYSDNFLAMLALPKDCDNASLATSIQQTLSEYNSSKLPNQYMVFICEEHFQGSNDYHINGPIWSTISNQTGLPLSASSYADIAFLQAYYDLTCLHNIPAALAAFNTGANHYNGIGFNDSPFQTGRSEGIYQVYKLALYDFTARLLNQTVPLSALVNMARMQAPSGGFYTGYVSNLSSNGTDTNTETTCLAILALGEN